MLVKSRISPAYTFIGNYLLPFHLAFHFQGPRWQKLCLKLRLWGKSRCILAAGGGKPYSWERGLLGENCRGGGHYA